MVLQGENRLSDRNAKRRGRALKALLTAGIATLAASAAQGSTRARLRDQALDICREAGREDAPVTTTAAGLSTLVQLVAGPSSLAFRSGNSSSSKTRMMKTSRLTMMATNSRLYLF